LSNQVRTLCHPNGFSVKLVFAGTPDVAIPSLRLLADSPHEIQAVITQPPAPSGRGRKITPSPVEEFAREHSIPVLAPERVIELMDQLIGLSPDCIPVVAYGQLIPPELLNIPRLGWVNLHFSLLPSWRGASPVQHAIWSGDQFTGCTTFVLDQGMDTGPVLGTMTEVIQPTDTSGDLLNRLASAGAILLRQSLDALESGKLEPQPQGRDGISYAPKIVKANAKVDWRLPALEVDRRIRSCTPAPGAWFSYQTSSGSSETVGIGPIQLVHEQSADIELAPGHVVVERKRILVGTGSHPVELGQVTPRGRRTMPAADWIRGLPCDPEFFV
jgi:methionyl-tRNA formyltransferase